MLLVLYAGCASGNGVQPVALSYAVGVGDSHMGVRLLGALRLPTSPVDGLRFSGISGLGWDQDRQRLYAISDRGFLFHLRPRFDRLGRLVDVERLNAYRLRDGQGRALRRPWRDAEGLAVVNGANGIVGDSELLISFEVEQRLQRYDPLGRRLGALPLPRPLRAIKNFRKPNRSLEAVALHPDHGLLLAPELPLRDDPAGQLSVFAGQQRRWRYPLHPSRGSALVAMEVLADGSLLTLERAFVSLLQPLVISLRHARLDRGPGLLQVRDLAVFDTSRGWLLDNFEGLSVHRDGRLFIVSDDNNSVLQSTLLVYLELLPGALGDDPE